MCHACSHSQHLVSCTHVWTQSCTALDEHTHKELTGTNNVHILRETKRVEKAEPISTPQLYHSVRNHPVLHILPYPGLHPTGLAHSQTCMAKNKNPAHMPIRPCAGWKSEPAARPAPHTFILNDVIYMSLTVVNQYIWPQVDYPAYNCMITRNNNCTKNIISNIPSNVHYA